MTDDLKLKGLLLLLVDEVYIFVLLPFIFNFKRNKEMGKTKENFNFLSHESSCQFINILGPSNTTICQRTECQVTRESHEVDGETKLSTFHREIVSNNFKNSSIISLLYLPVWMNLSGYFMGLVSAFIYYNNQTKGIKLSEVKWFNIVFHLSLTVGGVVTLLGVAFLAESKPSQIFSILYSSLDRVLVALCFNIFLLGCVSNCKSILKDILQWRGFHVLGRLSYSVFIVHFILMRLTIASNTHIGHVSIYSMISILVLGIVISYLIAIPIYLIVEMPAVQLWKALIAGDSKKEGKEEPMKLYANRPTDVPA